MIVISNLADEIQNGEILCYISGYGSAFPDLVMVVDCTDNKAEENICFDDI